MSAPEVIIVGAGPAGVRAAECLAENGIRPTVVDEGDFCGGQIYRRPPDGKARPYEALYGHDAGTARAIHSTFEGLLSRIDYRPRTLVWNVVDGFVHIHDRADASVGRLPFSHLILATGATDRLLPVPGWTLPGVFSLGGAQIALKSQGSLIGQRVCFAGTGPLLYLVALQYAKAGARVRAVIETSPMSRQLRFAPGLRHAPETAILGISFVAQLMARGIPVLRGATPAAVEGDGAVASLRVLHHGKEKTFDCDAVALGFGLRSETQLADLAGVSRVYDPRQCHWVPKAGIDGRTDRSCIYVAGDGAGILGAKAAELRGTRAALALLEDTGKRPDAARTARLEAGIARWADFRRALDAMYPVPVEMLKSLADDAVVCRCEKITMGDLRRVSALTGAEDANRLKSFSRAGMGRCQGRFCADNVQEIAAVLRGRPLSEMGIQRCQMPVKPIPLGDLTRISPRALPLEAGVRK